ncbi:MAG: DUF502 domain-containing protein [Deferribacteraceae bacterium]|jgi:uncharacterized membrane protein|nr:DUF502 domain-containing protein [Deferribacteraceae bacterium]
MKEGKNDHFVKHTVITGLVAMLPLVITIYILKILYNLIVSNLMPFFVKIAGIYQIEVSETRMGIITVILFIIITFMVGLLTRLYVGRFLLNLLEKTVANIPLANTIYNAIKQMIDSFNSSGNNFKKVVLVNFPSDSSYCLGFVVKDTQPVIAKELKEASYNVFIPTAPNPTSGFVAIFPVIKCVEINISVEEGIKFILSVGIINFKNDEEARTQLEKKK